MLNRRRLLITSTLMLCIGMGTHLAPARAHSSNQDPNQAPNQAPTQAPNLGAFFNSPMGSQINDMVQKSRQLPGFADPGISNEANLLTRTDVRNHLFLNGRQTEALTEQQANYLPSLAQQMVTTFMTMFQGANLQEMSPEDRKNYVTDMSSKIQDKVQETLISFQGDQDKKAKTVLKPDQIKRLHELDLQWRGPLALTDNTVGEPLQLTADQKSQLTALLKEYRTAQQSARGGFMGMGAGQPGLGGFGARPNRASSTPAAPKSPTPKNGNGDANGQPGDAANNGQNAPALPNPANFRMPAPEEMNAMLEDNNKKMVKLRKTIDEKALALLTPAQQQQWKTIQGKPFAFRQNP